MDYCSWAKGNYRISWDYDSSKIKEEQTLVVSTLEGDLEVTFKDVLFKFEATLEKIVKFLESSDKESLKIRGYLKRFKFDVDDEFRGEN